ncbi:hypothetical protein [Demequina muriae]|uniref:Uncharacterized protein n=1 Tax=Demequina muriae TaxID=3051664 RepID=A0ABT8GGL9_9MICO|nr:hypothetical protein [Demequina sp. EGI L300058]MDN4480582.1 hypothetical protein [Demequina sp. EGI L300058]
MNEDRDDDADDATRLTSRRRPTSDDDDDPDGATRIVTRRGRGEDASAAHPDAAMEGARDLDDATRLSSRSAGHEPDATRLSSRSGAPVAEPQEDATQLARPRGGPGESGAPGGWRRGTRPGELPDGYESHEVSRGTFGERDGAYGPRAASSATEVPRLEDGPPPARADAREAPAVVAPAEAARRRVAERRRRLLTAMGVAAALAAVVTLAVLAIVFLSGAGEP